MKPRFKMAEMSPPCQGKLHWGTLTIPTLRKVQVCFLTEEYTIWFYFMCYMGQFCLLNAKGYFLPTQCTNSTRLFFFLVWRLIAEWMQNLQFLCPCKNVLLTAKFRPDYLEHWSTAFRGDGNQMLIPLQRGHWCAGDIVRMLMVRLVLAANEVQ